MNFYFHYYSSAHYQSSLLTVTASLMQFAQSQRLLVLFHLGVVHDALLHFPIPRVFGGQLSHLNRLRPISSSPPIATTQAPLQQALLLGRR